MALVAAGSALALSQGAGAQTPLDATVFAFDDPVRFQVDGAPDGTTDVTILATGTVAFGYSSGTSRHNVHFDDAQPTSCVRFDSSDTVPPLPSSPRPAGWSGSCTFATPGSYPFHCDAHPVQMRGTITVVREQAPEPTPQPTPQPTPPPVTPAGPPAPSAPASPPAPPA